MSGKNQQNENQAAAQRRAAAQVADKTNSEQELFAEENIRSEGPDSGSMPDSVQTKMEDAFGTSFDDVSIDSSSQEAQQLGADAYTQGNTINFAPGKYNPESQAGQEVLGHELAHVVQQRNNQVESEVETDFLNANFNTTLESEADKLGEMAAAGQSTGLDTNTDAANSDAASANTASSDGTAQFFGMDLLKFAQSATESVGQMMGDEENSTLGAISSGLDLVSDLVGGDEEESSEEEEAEAELEEVEAEVEEAEEGGEEEAEKEGGWGLGQAALDLAGGLFGSEDGDSGFDKVMGVAQTGLDEAHGLWGGDEDPSGFDIAHGGVSVLDKALGGGDEEEESTFSKVANGGIDIAEALFGGGGDSEEEEAPEEAPAEEEEVVEEAVDDAVEEVAEEDPDIIGEEIIEDVVEEGEESEEGDEEEEGGSFADDILANWTTGRGEDDDYEDDGYESDEDEEPEFIAEIGPEETPKGPDSLPPAPEEDPFYDDVSPWAYNFGEPDLGGGSNQPLGLRGTQWGADTPQQPTGDTGISDEVSPLAGFWDFDETADMDMGDDMMGEDWYYEIEYIIEFLDMDVEDEHKDDEECCCCNCKNKER